MSDVSRPGLRPGVRVEAALTDEAGCAARQGCWGLSDQDGRRSIMAGRPTVDRSAQYGSRRYRSLGWGLLGATKVDGSTRSRPGVGRGGGGWQNCLGSLRTAFSGSARAKDLYEAHQGARVKNQSGTAAPGPKTEVCCGRVNAANRCKAVIAGRTSDRFARSDQRS